MRALGKIPSRSHSRMVTGARPPSALPNWPTVNSSQCSPRTVLMTGLASHAVSSLAGGGAGLRRLAWPAGPAGSSSQCAPRTVLMTGLASHAVSSLAGGGAGLRRLNRLPGYRSSVRSENIDSTASDTSVLGGDEGVRHLLGVHGIHVGLR